ncbi:hypothetical protein K3G63_07765 [Hymenobacter sp. HSC-4F20]|uniref:hypothetical protein n=1 Tax=Hymenobacter sp. HSC-4F20 TaxID=2864135 RepID=UPI001C72D244|nr:hypothetical protein [Hymenobacter sp. HSC-4F20]MBX0290330.1 hypothetical protein [Hymenobacter sp. HSC-4F20]
MPDTLLDVNLQQVADQELTGTWRVAGRVLSQADPTTELARATQLQLLPQQLVVATDHGSVLGQWSVERDALLSRPYLQLSLPQDSTTALVTRLRRSVTGAQRALTLYFHSGMELQLVQP